jgi:pyruvate/2-oxoacid:ferredoxin oxidoreductase alpha subunit
LERYGEEEAEILLVTAGAVTGTARTVVEKRVREGESVGGLKIKMLRPFPLKEFDQMIRGTQKIVVIERDLSSGMGGIIAQELRALLYHREKRPPVFGFVSGLGGRDITPALIEEALRIAMKQSRPEKDVLWLGLKS